MQRIWLNTSPLKSLLFSTIYLLAPSAAQAAEPHQARLEMIRQESLLGFGSPQYKRYSNIQRSLMVQQNTKALDELEKCIKENPDSIWPQLIRCRFLLNIKAYPSVLRQLQKTKKLCAENGEIYKEVYEVELRTYHETGNLKKEIETLESMIKLFPDSQVRTLERLADLYAHRKDKVNLAKTKSRITAVKLPARLKSPLLDLKTSGKPLPAGRGYEVMAQSLPFQRFKYNMNATCGIGDNGVSQYYQMPPNYDQVFVVNPESHNYVQVTMSDLLKQFIGGAPVQPEYKSVKAIAKVKYANQNCIQYLCQWRQDSCFDLITVAPEITISKPLAVAIAKLGTFPECGCAVLNATRVVGGYPTPLFQVLSVKPAIFNENLPKTVTSYHKLKSINELIIAGDGDMNAKDAEEFDLPGL